MIITIDGPAASGKGTVAKIIAQKLNIYYLNSGMLYRAIAQIILNKCNDDIHQLQNVIKTISLKNLEKYIKHIKYSYKNSTCTISYKDINITSQLQTSKCAYATSIISPYSHVRKIINKLQKSIATNNNIIIEGRDLGTVVFPNADTKFFLTADITVRAKRMILDKKRCTQGITLQKAIALLEERDKRDSKRKIAPLAIAKNAYVIDNSKMSIDETVEKMLDVIKNKRLSS